MDDERALIDSGGYKSFLEHLDDLRKAIVKMVIAVALGILIGFIFTDELVNLYLYPLSKVNGLGDPKSFLLNLGVADSFNMVLNIAMYGGAVISAPFILYFLGEFILPALTKKEKKYILPGVGSGIFLFLTGVLFAYFLLLPLTLDFFFSQSLKMGFKPSWSMMGYFSFVSNFLLAFGLSFELPIMVLILNRLGVLPARVLSKGRRYAFLIIVIIAAAVTPTSDAFTLMALSLPLYGLYEICVWIALFRERKAAN